MSNEFHTTFQQGSVCPRCLDSSRKKQAGTLLIRSGSKGKFLGCSRFPLCTFTCDAGKNLENQANALLKNKKPKKKRKRTKNKRTRMWHQEVKEAMEKHRAEKRARRQLAEHWQRANQQMN